MANTGVTMNYESLQTAATNVRSAQTDIQEVITKLTNAVNALQGNWSGDSYEAFLNAWQSSKPTLQKLAEAVGAIAPELEKTVAEQITKEGESAQRMSGVAF